MRALTDIWNDDSPLANKLRAALAEAQSASLPEAEAPICATCNDLGMVSYAVPCGHELFGKLYPCPDCARGLAIIQDRWKRRLQQSQLPSKYATLSFATFEALPPALRTGKMQAYFSAQLFVTNGWVSMAEVYALARKPWTAPDVVRNSLIFQGDYGVGKTGMAAAIVNALLAEGRAVLYTRVQDFISSVQRRYGKNEPPTAQDVIDAAQTAPVLVLDEFNLDIDSDNRREIMEAVIRYRHGHALPTVVTCNADTDALTAAWGNRTIEALLESAHLIRMGGAPLRDKLQPPKQEVF